MAIISFYINLSISRYVFSWIHPKDGFCDEHSYLCLVFDSVLGLYVSIPLSILLIFTITFIIWLIETAKKEAKNFEDFRNEENKKREKKEN